MAQLYWPIDPSKITEGYGWADWRGGMHYGIDFSVPQGTELLATASGTIRNVDAGQSGGAGVEIVTDDGWAVTHWHVSKFLLSPGTRVNPGDVIALSGGAPGTWGAGWSTGSHLHWGVKVGGQWTDPKSLNPLFLGSSNNTSKGNAKMLMIHKPNGDGQFRFAIFAPGFWLEFIGQDAANAFSLQVGASSLLTSEDFWTYCKNAAQAPINVKGGSVSGSSSGADASTIASAVNDEMAKRLKA